MVFLVFLKVKAKKNKKTFNNELFLEHKFLLYEKVENNFLYETHTWLFVKAWGDHHKLSRIIHSTSLHICNYASAGGILQLRIILCSS